MGNPLSSRAAIAASRQRNIRVFVAGLSAAILLGMTGGAHAQRVYVANSADDDISVIDATTLTTIGSITLPSGSDPNTLAISADGGTLAVGNFSGSASFIDLRTSPPTTLARLFPGSGNVFDVAFAPDGTKAYVSWSNSLSVVDMTTNPPSIASSVSLGTTYGLSSIAVSPNGARVYGVTGNAAPGSLVAIIDVTTSPPTVSATMVAVGGDSEQIAVSPDGTRAYVADQDTSNVSILDLTASPPTVTTVSVGGSPKGVAVSSNGTRVYATSNGVSAIDVTTSPPTVTPITISGASDPEGVAVSADGSTVYAGDFLKNTLSVVSTASNTVTNTIPVGTNPNGVVFAAAPPPGVSLSLAPATVPAGAFTVLTVTLSNPLATATPVTSLTVTLDPLTDAYGILSDTCGGTAATSSPPKAVTLTGGSIPASGSCVLQVQTAVNAPGTYTHRVQAGDLQTTDGSNAAAVSASFTVVAAIPPTASLTFAPASTAPGGPSRLTLTLTNANVTDLELVGLTDTLPAGLVVAATPDASTICPGAAVTATAGASSFSLGRAAPILPVATIPADGSCTASVSVTAATAGSYTDTLPAGAVQAYTIALSLPEIVAGNVADNSTVAASATLLVATTLPAPSLGFTGRLLLMVLLILLAGLQTRRSLRASGMGSRHE